MDKWDAGLMHDLLQRGQMERDERDKSVLLTVRLTSLPCIGECTRSRIKEKGPGQMRAWRDSGVSSGPFIHDKCI